MTSLAVPFHLKCHATSLMAGAATIAGFEGLGRCFGPELVVTGSAVTVSACEVGRMVEGYLPGFGWEHQLVRRLLVLRRYRGTPDEHSGERDSKAHG
jgi:hypothetical protein